MLEKFKDYIEYEKRFSKHTIAAYTKDLEQLSVYLSENYESSPENANHSMIRSWVIEQMENDITARSINRKLSTFRAYYKFLNKRGVRQDNPMAKVVAPKSKKRLPVFVDGNSMENISHPEHFTSDFAGARDQLIIELFYNTGIRLSELINIKIKDVTSSTIKVLGKRNKERIVPVSSSLAEYIENYLVYRDEIDHSKSEYLLLTDKGNKLYEKFVYRRVNYYLGKVTSLSKKSPHVLRHTFATHMLDNGASLNAIKEILGHANLTATQVYTHNSINKLKSVHNGAHPRGA